MTMAMVRCTQPGCDGTIQDSYCDTCGLAAPAASSSPSVLSNAIRPRTLT
jgi:serine/threonine-protein kinase PknG